MLGEFPGDPSLQLTARDLNPGPHGTAWKPVATARAAGRPRAPFREAAGAGFPEGPGAAGAGMQVPNREPPGHPQDVILPRTEAVTKGLTSFAEENITRA